MQLAHEIAINPDFRLQPYDPPETTLEKRIKAIMHDAFWDLLRGQLNSDPPCYDHAISLLGDIKEVHFSNLRRKSKENLKNEMFFKGFHTHHFEEQSKSFGSHL